MTPNDSSGHLSTRQTVPTIELKYEKRHKSRKKEKHEERPIKDNYIESHITLIVDSTST